ncbi:MAG TPA: hypothetical protein VJY35_03405 [Candidatus Eisenbacteria bacterium]|nr:hypothetical protein [Candidatus Eisenbacteria bacterium]
MHLATHHRFSSRLVTRLLLLLALVVSSILLTQCQMVGDRLNGVKVSPLRASTSCLKACKDKRNDDRNAANRLHAQLLHDCNGNAACIQQENARYNAALAAIEAAYQTCVNNCHQQGGGSN